MKIGIVGASGLVGKTMLKVLEERNFPASELFLSGSKEKSGQRVLKFSGKDYTVCDIDSVLEAKPELVFFSAGSDVSLKYANLFAENGSRVIDNSSAWRMSPEHKLIIPEINGSSLQASDKIIANPNCSTAQLLMVLAPLHRKYKIKRVVVSTYQSVSGTGMHALRQLDEERKDIPGKKVYPHPIDKNCLPHCDDFDTDNYTKEELKLVNETAKILDPEIKLTATAVRVPVTSGHSESVNIEFAHPFGLDDIFKLLQNAPGLILQDNPSENIYPMPVYAEGKDEVFVGRIRRDRSIENGLNLWIVADNLRKGAASNAVQIAESLLKKGFFAKK